MESARAREWLDRDGYAWIQDGIADADRALEMAEAVIGAQCAREPAPELIGAFVLPPADGAPSRAFQTLHVDFGVPLDPRGDGDVGRYTALYIDAALERVTAVTRLVGLAPLLGQRVWPSPDELLARLVAYGQTHGARADEEGYVEGSLARIVEAAAGTPELPSLTLDPGFLCGMEFSELEAEVAFFARHGLRLGEVEAEVPLAPGGLLVFDNLVLAHGRRGVRRPGELHQWVFGDPAVGVDRQRELRDQVLAFFRPMPAAVGS